MFTDSEKGINKSKELTKNSFNNFADRLNQAIKDKRTPCIVGLDTRFNQIPDIIRETNRKIYGETILGITNSIFDFNREVIDIIADYVPAVKPQIAFYELYGPAGIQAYLDTINYARKKGLIIIADVKRNDIGSTVKAYSQAYLGIPPGWDNAPQKPLFDVDAITVNPYLGSDGINPFLNDCEHFGKGIFVLVKTSNPSSSEFQNKLIENQPLYLHVAEKCREWGKNLIGKSHFSSVAVVVGATYPEEAEKIRSILPNAIFLIPGFGFQGGSAKQLQPFFIDGEGGVINSSRGIIHAYNQKPYSSAYGQANYREAINAALQKMIKQVADAIA